VILFLVSILSGLLAPMALCAHSLSAALGYTPPAPGTYTLPVIKPAIDGEVLDAAGVRRHLFDYMDNKIVLLSFIYTRCSDARGCPLATRVFYTLAEALQHDTVLAPHVRLLTLSFDPEYDTPARLRHYAGAVNAGKTSTLWHTFTTASRHSLQPLLDGYGQYVMPLPPDASPGAPGAYTHLLKVFLIDAQQRVRNIYSVDFLHPQILLNDIKTLLLPGNK
jgi:cytochrome c peroxidase